MQPADADLDLASLPKRESLPTSRFGPFRPPRSRNLLLREFSYGARVDLGVTHSEHEFLAI